jgi:hypothetical protein
VILEPESGHGAESGPLCPFLLGNKRNGESELNAQRKLDDRIDILILLALYFIIQNSRVVLHICRFRVPVVFQLTPLPVYLQYIFLSPDIHSSTWHLDGCSAGT